MNHTVSEGFERRRQTDRRSTAAMVQGDPPRYPIAFDGCSGWLTDGGGEHAVILCGPIGQEALAVHRGWRDLARQLAVAGVSALQFDYPGTGDSAGDETDPGQIARWVDSVAHAAKWLRSWGGATRISLLGLRLGATVAALAAPMVDADCLICLNPVVSGRLHLRELRLLGRTWWSQSSPDQSVQVAPDGAMDVIGYRWTKDNMDALAAVDLAGLTQWPQRVVLMDSTGRAEIGALADRLRSDASAVSVIDLSVIDFPGAAAFLQDALLSVVPQEAFDTICALLAEPHRVPRRHGLSLPKPWIDLHGAIETPLSFGPGGVLHGVLCRPSASGGRKAVLMLNTGYTHRVGHARLNVVLARALAKIGVASLRMDGAGIGDSGVPEGQTGRLLHDTAAALDVRAAIDALALIGLHEVTVLGLCTGGYQAFHTALVDKRIEAIIPINTQKFIWVGGPSFNVSYDGNRRATGIYLRASLSWENWRRVRRGEIDVPRIMRDLARRSVRSLRHKALQHLETVSGRDFGAGQLRRWIAELSQRGVRVRMIYSDADPGLADLCFEISPDRVARSYPGFSVEILPGADHTLSHIASRDDLIGRVLSQFAG